MGLEKAIKSGEEKRKQYQGSKIYASGCRNHGSCSWCLGARQHKNNKRLEGSKQELDEYNLSASENPEADFFMYYKF